MINMEDLKVKGAISDLKDCLEEKVIQPDVSRIPKGVLKGIGGVSITLIGAMSGGIVSSGITQNIAIGFIFLVSIILSVALIFVGYEFNKYKKEHKEDLKIVSRSYEKAMQHMEEDWINKTDEFYRVAQEHYKDTIAGLTRQINDLVLLAVEKIDKEAALIRAMSFKIDDIDLTNTTMEAPDDE